MQVGKASLRFEHPAFVASWASVAGKKEGQGPLADEIDVKEQDETFGMENWEQAESAMQKQAADLALEKGISTEGGALPLCRDLLGQLIATSFGTVDLEIPLFGLYGACSTMGEALAWGHVRKCRICGSGADPGFQPLRNGREAVPFSAGVRESEGQSATWTVTGCGR